MNPHDAHEDEDKGESDFTVWNAPDSDYDYEDSVSSESEGAVGDWSEGDEHLGAESDDESADPDSEKIRMRHLPYPSGGQLPRRTGHDTSVRLWGSFWRL